MFQVQSRVYWTYRRATFRALLQTSLRYQRGWEGGGKAPSLLFFAITCK